MSVTATRNPVDSSVASTGGRWRHVFVQIATLGLSLVLILSAVIHLQNLPQFYRSVIAYQIAPVQLGSLVTWLVPCVSFMTGMSLWLSDLIRAGLRICIGLMLGFFLVQVSVLVRGLDISCGCFGRFSTEPISWASACIPLLLGSTAVLLDFMSRTDFD